VEFIRNYYTKFINDKKKSNMVLDDMLNSVRGRCVDPSSLEQAALEKIASASEINVIVTQAE
jgi:hypothetical protein